MLVVSCIHPKDEVLFRRGNIFQEECYETYVLKMDLNSCKNLFTFMKPILKNSQKFEWLFSNPLI